MLIITMITMITMMITVDHNDDYHDDPNDGRDRSLMVNLFTGASREGGAKQGKPLQQVPVSHSHHHKT